MMLLMGFLVFLRGRAIQRRSREGLMGAALLWSQETGLLGAFVLLRKLLVPEGYLGSRRPGLVI